MYRVIIADDEPWVAYGIKKLVDWESMGYTVISEQYNGTAALEEILIQKPDVVLSDIRMPGLSGIELLEQIRVRKLPIRVILISGYAEFEYAQQAVRLGAFEYLLKQVDKADLTATLLRLKETLTKEKQAIEGLDLFLDDLFELFEQDRKMKINNFLTNRGVKFTAPHFRFISCLYPHTNMSRQAWGITGSDDMACLGFRTGQNKLSILLNYDEHKHPEAFQDFLTHHSIEACAVGLSEIGIYSTPITQMFQQSDIALSSALLNSGSTIMEYKNSELPSVLAGMLLKLELAVKEQRQDELNRILDDISETCAIHHLMADRLSTVYNQILSLLLKYYPGDKSYGLGYLDYQGMTREFGSSPELFAALKSNFVHRDEEIIHISNETIKNIIASIDAGFTEDILLSKLSKAFNISLGYLSSLIKKETGKTYTEYITQKRLGLAKELLANSDLSVYDIVQQVGYKDYFHFNKLFKKHVGITPSKYRKV